MGNWTSKKVVTFYERKVYYVFLYRGILSYFLLFYWFDFQKHAKHIQWPFGNHLLGNCIHHKCCTGWVYCEKNKRMGSFLEKNEHSRQFHLKHDFPWNHFLVAIVTTKSPHPPRMGAFCVHVAPSFDSCPMLRHIPQKIKFIYLNFYLTQSRFSPYP